MPPNDVIAVATDFGAVTLSEANEIKPLSTQPNITSFAISRGRLYAGLFTGGLVEIQPQSSNPGINSGADVKLHSQDARLVAGDDGLWLLSQTGAFANPEPAGRESFEPVAGTADKAAIVSASHVMSLTIDNQGRLWVGYFDKGLDLISIETSERLAHIEDDRVREVNFVTFDKAADRALIATSRGLVGIDGKAKQTVLTKEQGLIDNAVAHVSIVDDGSNSRGTRLLLATAGGLTELAQGRARSLTAFHGLSSNHLYTSASVGSRTFVGSLAGLVELEGLRVVRAYKKSNSKLSEDWVTALAEADGVLYVGTIGGIDALLPTGEWVNFADELGKVEVNQNAMNFDGERLYVGTSDKGLFVYNVRERRWSRISAGLPSQNVTSITSTDRFIYVGTLNGLMRIEKRIL
jgi:ligand-binding sensor domain-containing protein